VLLPAPDERPALMIYQEAGQFLGGELRCCLEIALVRKRQMGDSKTGRHFCLFIMQNQQFAY
jgi:hypothetical protein